MKKPRFLRLVAPLALVSSCLLPDFSNVPRSEEPVGGAINGFGGDGDGPSMGGSDATAGSAEGGQGNPSSAPQPVADTYVLQQGKSLSVSARDGVLSNDDPNGLAVSAFEGSDAERPAAFDGELDIAADGSLEFTPVPEFFGRYTAHYTATNEAGDSADASVTFIVQPAVASLDVVAEGVGGVLLTGSAGEELGTALTGLGDVNGDGFDDFAVGAPGAAAPAGAVYVVFGSASFGALTLGSLSTTSKETRFAVLEGSDVAPVGRNIASAGKFNSDAIGDILIGSPSSTGAGAPDGDTGDGSLFVVYGGSELRTSLTLPGLEAERGIEIFGKGFTRQLLGAPVAGGGDFNGDEKADLLAGLFEAGDTSKGACVIMENPVARSSIVDLTHATITDAVDDLPTSLAFAGDLNGDGKDDVVAASLRHVALLLGDGNGTLPADLANVSEDGTMGGYKRARAGNATGLASVAAAGDANGDGKDDVAYCDRLSGEPACVLVFGHLVPGTSQLASGDWRMGGFGASPPVPLLATSADLNEDGYADALMADDASAYVVFGRESGFGEVDVSSLGADGFAITAATDGSVGAIATLGDVNGDGYVDFGVGDPTAGSNSGRVYVVLGGPFSADQR